MAINEKNAETLIQEHLRDQGWDLTDFSTVTRGFRDLLDGEEADFAFLLGRAPAAFLEAKKPGKDLYAALEQAKGYAKKYRQNGGSEVALIFGSDGTTYLRQNLRANTLPEKIVRFPTPAEFRELFNPQATTLLGTLRDYQRVAVSQVLGATQAGRTRMYLQMATGTGKTITAAGIIAKLWSVGLLRRALFLVDRDALAAQTERKFKEHLGDNLIVRRATGHRDDRFADVLVTTIQHLAVRRKFGGFPGSHFDAAFLDECHRSYFGDWYPVLEYFAGGGARLVGLTATPSDKETQSTDRFFSDRGQPRGPIYRYTIRQGEQAGILAQCHHFKFHTNLDLHGIHDMGFDFEPEQLGRAVDVPDRNRLIADKYFEIIGRREPAKTIVFAASIQHAKNLRYALIGKYNELNHLPPNDATAEEFIVAIHNEQKAAPQLIETFQQVNGPIKIAVGVGMLDTGIDAPDVEIILMARPTKSKILYVQMKGRGTRKCDETGKDFYKLVDFVDISRLEDAGEVITNETPGVVDVDEREDEEELAKAGLKRGMGESPREDQEDMERVPQEMMILDMPVVLESSEVIAPAVLESLRRQIETQLHKVVTREGMKERFCQAVFSWRYFKADAPVDHTFLATMGFDIHTLRDVYGEAEATLEDFISVARGEADFALLRQRREFEKWAQEKGLSKDKRELVLMLCDFRRANPNLTAEQTLRSQWLDYHGGLARVRALFGSLKSLIEVSEQAMSILNPGDEEAVNGQD